MPRAGARVEFKFVKSSRTDKPPCADAVVAALKPFAVIDAASRVGTGREWRAGVEQTVPTPVFPIVATAADRSPAERVYGLNAAEIIGKYLKGGKAEFAGDELKGKIASATLANSIEFFEQQLRSRVSRSESRVHRPGQRECGQCRIVG